jgi:hypothetical protein
LHRHISALWHISPIHREDIVANIDPGSSRGRSCNDNNRRITPHSTSTATAAAAAALANYRKSISINSTCAQRKEACHAWRVHVLPDRPTAYSELTCSDRLDFDL